MSLPCAGVFVVPAHLHSEHDQGNQGELQRVLCVFVELVFSSISCAGWFTEQMYKCFALTQRSQWEQMAREREGISLGSTNLKHL